MGFKRVGDWAKTQSVLSRLRSTSDNVQRQVLAEWAVQIEAIVKGHIMNQDLPWAPLSDSHASRKAAAGDFEEIYLMTGDYHDNIQGRVVGKTVQAGVDAGAVNARGYSLEKIGATLEYGSPARNIPARPLWGPSLEEMREWIISYSAPHRRLVNQIQAQI